MMAELQPSPATRTVTSPFQLPRSCHACRRRKIRCDKQQPCSYCIKIKVDCTYPSPNEAQPPIRRRPRSEHPIATSGAGSDLPTAFEHIRQLELHVQNLESRLGLLEARGGDDSLDAPVTGTTVNGPPDSGDWRRSTPARRLWEVIEDEAEPTDEETELSEYEERAAKETTPDPNDGGYSTCLPTSKGNRISYLDSLIMGQIVQSSDTLPQALPSTLIVNHLWKLFRANVDPVVKLLDISSTQELINKFLSTYVTNVSTLDPSSEALVYSILYTTIISLQGRPDGTVDAFDSREGILFKFQQATERALSNSRVLSKPSLTSLRALTLYLVGGRRYLDNTLMLSLTSVLVTLSKKLELDNPQTMSSGVENRMTGCLWLQIIGLDTWVAEMNNTDPLIDVTDVDLEQLVMQASREIDSKDKYGFPDRRLNVILTTRIFVIRVARAVQFSDTFSERNKFSKMATNTQKVDYMKGVLDQDWHNLWSNDTIEVANLPEVGALVGMAKMMLVRMRLAIYLVGHRKGDGCPEASFQGFTQDSIQILEEASQLSGAPGARVWLWLSQQHVEWDSAGILMSCLLIKPADRDLMARADAVLTKFFENWQRRVTPAQLPRWQNLQKLRNKLKPLFSISRAMPMEAIPMNMDAVPDFDGWMDLDVLKGLDFDQNDFWL